MKDKTQREHQMTIFEVALESIIDTNHKLVLLWKQIELDEIESQFMKNYNAE